MPPPSLPPAPPHLRGRIGAVDRRRITVRDAGSIVALRLVGEMADQGGAPPPARLGQKIVRTQLHEGDIPRLSVYPRRSIDSCLIQSQVTHNSSFEIVAFNVFGFVVIFFVNNYGRSLFEPAMVGSIRGIGDTMETATATSDEPKEALEQPSDAGSAHPARTSVRGKRSRELQALVDPNVGNLHPAVSSTSASAATAAAPAAADPNFPHRGGASKRPRYPAVQVALAAPDDRKRDRWKGTRGARRTVCFGCCRR
jgi:hypothetical protein